MAWLIERFWDDKSGDPAVDWLMLVAGALMLATALVATFAPGMADVASDNEVTAIIDGV